MLLKGLIVFSAVIVVLLSFIGLFTDTAALMPYLMLSLGILMVVSGINEIKNNNRKFYGYFYMAASIIVFTAFIYSF
ncbi:DUF3953 domain-containing protein [Halobacillus sp. Marseille-Q1614]|uniref:DUF3953 domain-containing protein n=1 Tax=Halobacillus sp. Marseille-Q1614 TaxID=2709134 RepID=UPI001570CD63|nr:DUF3953 domain-containing protein [Halobacillus sp. Marseille-Q1614]